MIKFTTGLVNRWAGALFSAYSGTSPDSAAKYLLGSLGGGVGITFIGKALQDATSFAYVADIGEVAGTALAKVSNTNMYAFTSADASSVSITGTKNGSLNLVLTGTDSTAAVAGFAYSDSLLEFPLVTITDSFILNVDLAAVTGLELSLAKGRIQIGVGGGFQADLPDDVLTAPATDAVYVEISEQKFRLVAVVAGDFFYSPWSGAMLRSGDDVCLELAINFGAYGVQTASARVKGKGSVGLQIPKGITNDMTIFGRIGHTAAYLAAETYKLSAKVEVISLVKGD